MDPVNNYIQFSQLVGSYLELVQGSGGNISVKDGTFLCVKSSGRMLSETTQGYGYSICQLSDLESKFTAGDMYLEDTACGGEEGSTPSMETFFHLLPSKWVVHIHPIFLLPALCHPRWRSITTRYSHLHIGYYTPGLELGRAIRQVYQGEKVLFLKSHGIIICAESAEEACEILDTLYAEHTNKQLGLSSAWTTLMHASQLQSDKPPVMRHCNHISNFHERLFMPITPDITLFLKKYPLVQESPHENIQSLLDTYSTHFKTLPAVVRIQGRVFVFGKTPKHCICVEEILESYVQIMASSDANQLEMFEDEDTHALETSPQEVHRLGIL